MLTSAQCLGEHDKELLCRVTISPPLFKRWWYFQTAFRVTEERIPVPHPWSEAVLLMLKWSWRVKGTHQGCEILLLVTVGCLFGGGGGLWWNCTNRARCSHKFSEVTNGEVNNIRLRYVLWKVCFIIWCWAAWKNMKVHPDTKCYSVTDLFNFHLLNAHRHDGTKCKNTTWRPDGERKGEPYAWWCQRLGLFFFYCISFSVILKKWYPKRTFQWWLSYNFSTSISNIWSNYKVK